jgi:hypothetical protein
VQVFRGDGVLQTFTAPSGGGRWWHVFDFDCAAGTINAVNQVSDSQPAIAAGPAASPPSSGTASPPGAGAGPAGVCAWTGTWSTAWGQMTLTQSGSSVTGNYPHDQGRVTGTVSGNALTGTWSESPSYRPPSDAGDMQLTMAADCNSFTGRWHYGSSGDWTTNWSGTRAVRRP